MDRLDRLDEFLAEVAVQQGDDENYADNWEEVEDWVEDWEDDEEQSEDDELLTVDDYVEQHGVRTVAAALRSVGPELLSGTYWEKIKDSLSCGPMSPADRPPAYFKYRESRGELFPVGRYSAWADLVDELLLEIFKRLDVLDLVVARQVCSNWRRVASDWVLWLLAFDCNRLLLPAQGRVSILMHNYGEAASCQRYVKLCGSRYNKRIRDLECAGMRMQGLFDYVGFGGSCGNIVGQEALDPTLAAIVAKENLSPCALSQSLWLDEPICQFVEIPGNNSHVLALSSSRNFYMLDLRWKIEEIPLGVDEEWKRVGRYPYGTVVFDGHMLGCSAVCVTPCGKFCVTAGATQTMRFWDLSIPSEKELSATGSVFRGFLRTQDLALNHRPPVTALACSETELFVAQDAHVQAYAMSDGKKLGAAAVCGSPVLTLSFRDGMLIAGLELAIYVFVWVKAANGGGDGAFEEKLHIRCPPTKAHDLRPQEPLLIPLDPKFVCDEVEHDNEVRYYWLVSASPILVSTIKTHEHGKMLKEFVVRHQDVMGVAKWQDLRRILVRDGVLPAKAASGNGRLFSRTNYVDWYGETAFFSSLFAEKRSKTRLWKRAIYFDHDFPQSFRPQHAMMLEDAPLVLFALGQCGLHVIHRDTRPVAPWHLVCEGGSGSGDAGEGDLQNDDEQQREGGEGTRARREGWHRRRRRRFPRSGSARTGGRKGKDKTVESGRKDKSFRQNLHLT